NQLRYRDILVGHTQGYTTLPSFAPGQNLSSQKIFSLHPVNGYKKGNAGKVEDHPAGRIGLDVFSEQGRGVRNLLDIADATVCE
ncbi:MAG: hypothetical protein M1376_11765, partial [Planctomycetes bacterium]|nr:hypothetical protein [Planctomycetota bacterium]